MAVFNFSPFPVQVTEDLLLRQVSENDAAQLLELRSNEQVNRYVERKKATSIEDALAFIDIINKGIAGNELVYWGIQLKNDLKVIGTIGLFNLSAHEDKAEIGYELLPGYQGKGLMQQAMTAVIQYGFHIMRLQMIEAWTVKENLASARVLQKMGFELHDQAVATTVSEDAKNDTVMYVLKSPIVAVQ